MWKIAKLGDICKIQSGNSIPVKEKELLYRNVNEGLPYVATKDVGFNGVIDYENGVRIPSNYSSKFKLSKKNSILVCAEGGSAGRKIAFSNRDCHFVNKLFSINPGNKITSKYIYYYTLGNEFQSQFKKSMHGLIGGVSLLKIKNFQITHPPLPEQQRIVDKLDAAFAEIDKTININKDKKHQIQSLRSSIFNNKINQKGKKIKIKDVCINITDGSHFSPKTVSSGYPYITVRDINNDKIDFSKCRFVNKNNFNELIKNGCSPKKNDLLFSKDGTVGKVTIIKDDTKFVVLSSLAILTCNQNLIIPEYFFYVLKSPLFLSEAIGKKTGVAIKRIVLKNLKNIEISLPDLEEQKKIIHQLNEITGSIAVNLNLIAKQQGLYEVLKNSLLSNYLKSEAA